MRERRRARTRRGKASLRPLVRDVLEPRVVLSGMTGASDVAMLSATTTDSQGVTVDYQIGATAGASLPLEFGVYRSADAQFDASDVLLGSWTADAGSSDAAAGSHQVTIPVAGGLPIDTARPYVLVVANPNDAGATTDPGRTASFRTYVIGVVSHGGLVHTSWKYAPPWALQTAKLMQWQGYDAAFPFNWTSDSRTAGRAARQGPKLARQINAIAEQFPASAVVDLHVIGHSEGAMVNSLALSMLAKSAAPQLQRGFVQDTMLDPHAANNNSPGQLSASNTIMGAIARVVTTSFQADADDPAVFVPANVDETEVFYQHTLAMNTHAGGDYNLWGQVPVPNLSPHPIHYYNLTATGASHSGLYGVQLWYRNFVATTLHNQAPLVEALRLEGGIVNASPSPEVPTSRVQELRQANWGAVQTIDGDQPTFSGTAAPGSTLRLYVGPTGDLTKVGLLGTATAAADGTWTVTTHRPLPDGRYRAVVMAYSRALHTRPAYAVVPMAPMGRFVIGKD
ncbi:MAG: Ig-like domain-containing protein [Paludisphaera borealis]|uniref:Ig-like domain-containing protein n=1 Tax=Paludisphaera borealis TaxID=1387353 RepID=UPI002851D5FE|nr:Ig-like domain-containing protein [Paludisphaera borealis]MDR3618271.1 Ig-like domain-containing protein [Paludisphaera borealis]